MKRQKINSISIIGAGISAFACAYYIVKQGYRGSISLYDQSSHLGGRLVSQTSIDNKCIYEMGAGRFHEKHHPQLDQLCKEFNLALKPFSYQVIYKQGVKKENENITMSEIMECLSQTALDHSKINESFSAFFTRSFNKASLNNLISQSGYSSLGNPKLPIAGGFSILCHHPETQGLFKGNMDGWSYIENGFQQLPYKILDQIQHSVDIHLHSSLLKISTNPNETHQMIIENKSRVW